MCKNPSNKKIYNYVNKKLKTKPFIPPLYDKSSNTYLNSDKEKTNLLNSYFQSVYTTDDGKIPNSYPKPCIPMEDFEITSYDILQAITSLKDKISRTPENIPSYFIKRIGSSILEPLKFIFNQSLRLHHVPNQWKTSLIIPIHKKNSKTIPNNYRPISLTSSFSRLFETIIHHKIMLHLMNNSLLSKEQFGFIPGRSSCSQLVTTVHEWYTGLANNNSMKVIYTDISKAFDSVSHKKLIHIIRTSI